MASTMAQGNMATAANTVNRVQSTSSWISQSRAENVLYYIHFTYPIVLFFLFVVAFAAHGIITASANGPHSDPPTVTGPGGKPLPIRLLREIRSRRSLVSVTRRDLCLYGSQPVKFLRFLGTP